MEDDSAARNHPEKRELRSPHDTEPDAAEDVAGRVDAALRRAAVAGVVAPEAAAQQTVRQLALRWTRWINHTICA